MYLRLARLPGVVVCAPSHDDVAGGPILHAVNCRVKARRAPAARPVVVPQDQIRHVRLAVEQGVETRAEHDARAVAVPGCTACSAVARARRHVAWLRRAGGSVLRRAPRRRGGVPPPPVRGGPTAGALGGPPPKARGAGEFRTAPNTRNARHCAARRWRAVVRCAAWPWPPTYWSARRRTRQAWCLLRKKRFLGVLLVTGYRGPRGRYWGPEVLDTLYILVRVLAGYGVVLYVRVLWY